MGVYASDSIGISLATEQKREQSLIQRGRWEGFRAVGLRLESEDWLQSAPWKRVVSVRNGLHVHRPGEQSRRSRRRLGTDQMWIQSTSFRGQKRLAQAECQGTSQRMCVSTQADTT